MRLAILTNFRQADQFHLQKPWIKWEYQWVELPLTKNGEPRIVQLSAEAEAILRECCQESPSPIWVFPGFRKKSRPMSARWFYNKIFKPACKAAEIEPPSPKTKLWHALRHTFGQRAAQVGYSAEFLTKAGGWETERAAKEYIEAERQDIRAVMEAVSAKKPIAIVTESSDQEEVAISRS